MFITFEGIDGCGKTTQIELLKKRLLKAGVDFCQTREPGGTKLAEAIREMLLRKGREVIHPQTEALLYAAARSQHVREIIRPALTKGQLVICDRYIDSSLVYQGIGRGLGIDCVNMINEPALDGLWPDVTFLLDLDVPMSMARMKKMGKTLDRLESEDISFKRRLHQGYLDIGKRFPERIVILDAKQSPEEISKKIWERLDIG